MLAPRHLAGEHREVVARECVGGPFSPGRTRLSPELQSDQTIDANVRLPPQTHLKADHDAIADERPHTASCRPYSGSVGRTVLIMNSLNLSFSSVFGRCAERSNQTTCFRGAFNASKYFAESTDGTS